MEIDCEDPTLIKKIREKKMMSELQSRTQDRELILMASMLYPFNKDLDFLPKEERLNAHPLLVKLPYIQILKNQQEKSKKD